jgi:NAD(P)-dependent dehydrogenase (short-subunit alcohol dehydrogenase family)
MNTQKVWFITGASRGLGFEITKAVLAAGDKVTATVRGNPEALAARLGAENLLVVGLDVTREEQAKAAVTEAVNRFGRIDVLVNNAGYGVLGAVEEASDGEIRKNYDTNVFGLLNVTRAVLPVLRAQRSGRIINITSVGGLTASAGWGLYGSTKFAVEGLTEALAKELAPLGIYATAVEPGYFRTDFLDEQSLSRAGRVIEDYDETVGRMRRRATEVNQRQPGDPRKLAAALIRVANSPWPPLHLPLGKDCLNAYRAKTALFEQDIEAWFDVITGTDHDDAQER